MGGILAVLALLVGLINTDPSKAPTTARAHAALASLLGIGAIGVGISLTIVEYQNSALAWAACTAMLLSALMMAITMLTPKQPVDQKRRNQIEVNWKTERFEKGTIREEHAEPVSVWGDWTSHYERTFFLAFAVLLGGVPGGNTCP